MLNFSVYFNGLEINFKLVFFFWLFFFRVENREGSDNGT